MPKATRVNFVPHVNPGRSAAIWGNAPYSYVQVSANGRDYHNLVYLGEDAWHEIYLELGRLYAKRAHEARTQS